MLGTQSKFSHAVLHSSSVHEEIKVSTCEGTRTPAGFVLGMGRLYANVHVDPATVEV